MWITIWYALAFIGYSLYLVSEACDVRLESKHEHSDS